MEKAIIILTSSYDENASANGICAVSIMRSLERMGYRVFIVGIGKETYISGNKYYIKSSKPRNDGARLLEYLRAIKRMITPIYSKSLVSDYINTTCKIINDNTVEEVVSVYYPLESIVALKAIKSRFPGIKCVSYELDSATDGIHPGGRGDQFFDKAYFRWMKKIYRKIDRIFIMESHRIHFEEHYSELINKTEFVDIPVLNKPELPSKENYDGPVQFFYTGILDKSYRSPLKALHCLSALSEQNDWQVHFYSRGNCEELIKKWTEKNPQICQHGYVSQDELNRELSEADFLLNIGNANSNSLPSKLISYFALGKPIIHFSMQKNDICEDYLRRYPLALIIGADEEVEQAKARIHEFVKSHLHDIVSYDEVKSTYVKNTPEYSAGKLVGRT